MTSTLLARESRPVVSSSKAHQHRWDDEPLLTAEQECQLARAQVGGDVTARDRLVQSNLRLVIVIARDYLGRGLSFDDLIGEGNIGLFRAAQDFDPKFGCRFSTYAVYWIKQSIRHALINTATTIRLPAHMVTMLSKLNKVERDLVRHEGEATFEQAAGQLGLSQGRCELATSALQARRVQPMTDAMGAELATRSSSKGERPEEEVERTDDARCLRAMMEQRLTPREQEILKFRFGLDGVEPMTLQQIGRMMGITREYVRKLERRAIDKQGQGECPFGN